jgi:hypothetical protein
MMHHMMHALHKICNYNNSTTTRLINPIFPRWLPDRQIYAAQSRPTNWSVQTRIRSAGYTHASHRLLPIHASTLTADRIWRWNTMTTLRILQYNVWKSPAIVTPVLTDRLLESYDILAIQEPAKRKDIDDVICPGQCPWQAARGEVLGQTCFYINKRIAQAKRSLHTYDTPDVFSLRLQLGDRIL